MNLISGLRKLSNVKFLRSLSVYVFATFFNKGVNFLLLPIFTYYLTPDDYGVLSLINTTISASTILIMAGTDGAIRKQYYMLEGEAYASFLSSGLFITLVSFLIVGSIAFGASPFLAEWLEVPRQWFVIASVAAFLSIVPTVLQGQNRVQKKAKAYAFFTNSMTLGNLLLGLLFVAVLHWGYSGRVISILLVNLVFTVIALFLLHKQKLLNTSIKKTYIRRSLNYGIPIIPHLVSALVINYSDRVFIASMVNVTELGIYNVAYTIGTVLLFAVEAFSLAYIPFLFENLKLATNESYLKIVRLTYAFTTLLVICLILLLVSAPFIFKWVINHNFSSGIKYVGWIALGAFFFGMYKLFTGFIYYFNKTKYLAYFGLINIIINISLNYWLIGAYGALGAAFATLFSFIIMFLLTFFVSSRLVNLPWFSKAVFKLQVK